VDFSLNLDAIEAAIGPKTLAVLINSPNNPTGRVYSAESMAQLGDLLSRKSRETGRLIFLVSDEPYRRIVYDGIRVPSVLSAYENTVIASSYSKELSLAGERIGYLAANPAIPDVGLLGDLCHGEPRLGFVNAPSHARALAHLPGACVDLSLYQRNRRVLGCGRPGEVVPPPQGAFILPPPPLSDDIAFTVIGANGGRGPRTGFGPGCCGCRIAWLRKWWTALLSSDDWLKYSGHTFRKIRLG
jgi:aspartate aminotransferase